LELVLKIAERAELILELLELREEQRVQP